jgi:hypothetical protein
MTIAIAEQEQIEQEAEEWRLTLLAQDTTWWPTHQERMRELAEGNIYRPVPTLWQRDDGVSLIYPGRSHIFMGESEALKTWSTLVAVAQEIRAGNAVLFIDLEDDETTAIERLLQLGLTVDEVVEGFLYFQPGGRFEAVAAARIDYAIERCERPVTLAVIDSITEAMALNTLDPDKGTDVAKFYHGLPAALMKHGLAVIMIDHVVKTRDSRGRWAIGSERKISGLTGAAYVFESIVPFGRGMVGKVKVTLSKDRVGSVRPLGSGPGGKNLGTITFSSDPETGMVATSFSETSGGESVTALAARLAETETRLRRETWQVIDEDPGIGSTLLLGRVTGQKDAVNETRQWLIEQGYVRTEKVGKTTGHFTIQPLP